MLYKSTGYIDELAWAAAWLYKATGTTSYLDDARKYYSMVRVASDSPSDSGRITSRLQPAGGSVA